MCYVLLYLFFSQTGGIDAARCVFVKPRQVTHTVSSISGILEEKSGSENCFYLGALFLFDRCRKVIKSQSTSLPDSFA